jgi:hypothetical protein
VKKRIAEGVKFGSAFGKVRNYRNKFRKFISKVVIMTFNERRQKRKNM